MSHRKKEERMHGDDFHSGTTSTGYSLTVNRFPKGLQIHKKSGTLRFAEVKSFTISGPSGEQSVSILYAGVTTQQFLIGGTASNPQGDALPLISLNPYQGVTNSGVYTTYQAKPAQDQLFIRGLTLEVDLSNFATTAQYVDLYLVKAKHDQPSDSQTAWVKGLTIQGLGVPDQVFGIIGGTTAASGAAKINQPMLTPRTCREWGKMYHILRKHHINLGASASEKVTFSMLLNQWVSTEDIAALNPAITNNPTTWTGANVQIPYLRGSVQLMAVVRGVVVVDATTGGTKQATTGTADVGFVVSSKYTCKVPMDNANRLAPQLAYCDLATQASLGNLKSINITDQAAGTTAANT